MSAPHCWRTAARCWPYRSSRQLLDNLFIEGYFIICNRRALSSKLDAIVEQKRAASQEHAHGNQSSVPKNKVGRLLAP